jgi:hypothetical protein
MTKEFLPPAWPCLPAGCEKLDELEFALLDGCLGKGVIDMLGCCSNFAADDLLLALCKIHKNINLIKVSYGSHFNFICSPLYIKQIDGTVS